MKPQRFKKGQEVVCVDDDWSDDKNYRDSGRVLPNPMKHNIYTVESYCGRYCNVPGPSFKEPYLHIVGFVCCFSQDAFAPVVSDAVLEKELSEIEVLV